MKPERRLVTTPLTLEIARDLTHAEAIEQEWTRFAGALPGATPFQLPAWQLTWWRHFGAGRLHILLFRNLDSLVGVAPFYLSELNGRPTLRLLGTGMASYLEPAIAAAQRSDVAQLLKSHLLANHTWERCDWRDLAANSPLVGLDLGEGYETRIEPDREWPQISIQGTFQEYWESRSFSLRKNFLRYLDNSAAAGDRPRLEVVDQADPEFVNAMIRLRGEQSEALEAAKDGAAAYLVELTKVCDRSNLLRMFGLRYNRKLVAVTLAMEQRGVVYALLSGSDPAFEALGFGRLLLFESLRHAFQERYRAWSFPRGNEAYKLLWGAQIAPTTRVSIERKKAEEPKTPAPELQ